MGIFCYDPAADFAAGACWFVVFWFVIIDKASGQTIDVSTDCGFDGFVF